MSHRHKNCCCCEPVRCCKPVCSCGNSCGTGGIGNCGAGSGIWIIIILLIFCSGGLGGFGGLCR